MDEIVILELPAPSIFVYSHTHGIWLLILNHSCYTVARNSYWLACLLSGPVIFHSHQRVPLLLAAAAEEELVGD